MTTSPMRGATTMFILFIILSVLTLAATQCVPNYPCTDCNFMSVERNAKDCQIYYYCNYGRVVTTRSCGYNQVYSTRIRSCVTSNGGASSTDRCSTASVTSGTPPVSARARQQAPLLTNLPRSSQRRPAVIWISGASGRRRPPVYIVRSSSVDSINSAANNTNVNATTSTSFDTTSSRTPADAASGKDAAQLPVVAPDFTDKLKLEDKCGIKVTSYVLGGQRANRAEWAWQVSIQAYDVINNGYVHVCGGTLIDETWVITAAHCVYSSQAKLRNFLVVAGQYRLRSQDPWRQIRSVDKAISHPGFRPFGNFANDIAMLRLSRPFNFTTAVRPACLPQTSDLAEYITNTFINIPGQNNGFGRSVVNRKYKTATKCWTTGFGRGQGREVVDREVLREVGVRFLDPFKCRQLWPGFVKHFHICAVARDGTACKGDSGGPLVCEDEGRYFLQGVVSWGEGTCNLRNRLPTVYTRVADFIDWIQYNIKRFSRRNYG